MHSPVGVPDGAGNIEAAVAGVFVSKIGAEGKSPHLLLHAGATTLSAPPPAPVPEPPPLPRTGPPPLPWLVPAPDPLSPPVPPVNLLGGGVTEQAAITATPHEPRTHEIRIRQSS